MNKIPAFLASDYVILRCALCRGTFSYRKPWTGRPQGPQCQCNPNTWGNWKRLQPKEIDTMSGVTDDPNDPAIKRGAPDTEPTPQHEKYLVLSEAERAKGFIRPVRSTYWHVGKKPRFPLVDLTDAQKALHGEEYAKYEPYPESEAPVTGRYWTQRDLDTVKTACNTRTTMGNALAETYAREPSFYGATYCVRCSKHLSVEEFVWEDGTTVGS